MRLSSITANRHVFDGRVNGKPIRLLIAFDTGRTLQLRVAGDGAGMIVDDGPLDAPQNMGKYGHIEVADVTQSLFSRLAGTEVTEVRSLALNGTQVGVKLSVSDGKPFHFWVDGDELWWGEQQDLLGHDWLNGVAPSVSERIQV